MSPLKIDEYLLERAEKFAWKFECENGYNNFFLTKACVLVGVIILEIMYIRFGWEIMSYIGETLVVIVIIFWMMVDQIELMTGANMKGLNPLRESWKLRAMVMLGLPVLIFMAGRFDWFVLLAVLSFGFIVLATYFLCCNGKPTDWEPEEEEEAEEHEFSLSPT